MELMSLKQAAKYLDRSIGTLKNWEKRGLLKPSKVDPTGHRLYNKEDLEKIYKSGGE